MGAGSICGLGSPSVWKRRLARCSALSTARPWGDPGRPPRSVASFAGTPPRRVRRRFAPHQLRHAHVVELARESVSLNVIQRQLEHANLRHHEHLPAGNRHRGDHLHRARPPSADDVGDSGPPALSHRTPSRERRGVCSRVRRPRHFCFSPSSARQTAALVAIPRRLVLVLTSRPERSSADARKSREAAVSALRQFEEGMSCIRDRMVTRRLSYRHG